MQYREPLCLRCEYFKGRPLGPKEKARCAVKARGISESIYYKGGNCNKFKPRGVSVGKREK